MLLHVRSGAPVIQCQCFTCWDTGYNGRRRSCRRRRHSVEIAEIYSHHFFLQKLREINELGT